MRENKMMFIVFMLGTFTVGMAEYVVTGLLTQIASDMKVSISSAGLLISVYAISVAVIGPFMRIFTLKVHGHRLLAILVAIFIISNLVGMLAPNFNVLLLSRLMSAAMHAPFFGVCMSVAAAVAPPAKKPQAIALVQAGLTIAVMIGVPFGSFLGGFANWRTVFGVMIGLAVITMLGMIKFVPKVSLSAEANIANELKVFKNPHILIVISIIVFGYSGVFTTYTFMEPMIRDFSPYKVVGLTVSMSIYVRIRWGNWKFSHRKYSRTKINKESLSHIFTFIRYNYSVCNSCSLRDFSINHMFYVRFRNIWHNAIAQQQDYTKCTRSTFTCQYFSGVSV